MNKKNTRRPNGEGSVYQMKDGRFGTAFSLGKDESGKRLRHVETGKTKQEAMDKMHLWLSKNGYLEEEKVVINGQTTVQDFVEEFKVKALRNSVRKDKDVVSDVTYYNYVCMLQPFVTAFAGKRICEVDAYALNKFFSGIKNSMVQGKYQYSKTSIGRMVLIIGRMFNRAVEKNYLDSNPMNDHDFKIPQSNKEEKSITALTNDEVDKLLNTLKSHNTLYPVVRFMLQTGVRTQEALALQWGDIDFDKKKVSIRRAFIKKIDFDDHGNKTTSKTVVGPTKSKSGTRTISVPDSLIVFLQEWRERAPAVSKAKTSDEDFVFGTVKGPSWTCDGFRSALNRYLKKSGSGIDRLRPHRLRHTVATKLSNQPGINAYHVMQLLGHNDTRTAEKYIDRQCEERDQKNQEVLCHISKEMDF
ncbi:tyrosine-type recombinase/integrase [Flavonifractor sp. An9]|uniref:tyrosine-type recombinase/integrase n=1 Tax=Flavonifractor sp. An9 TaxID=1965664 RepID=UPI000B38C91D|nr:site-specific integrase [Flavonifractor sp. An9]OUN10071.1 hypothetical protein B5G40_10970 [Flavonifractor sp. An9]